MKKLVVISMMLIGLLTITSSHAWAIIADGVVSPALEWGTYRLNLPDPSEADVPDNYDVKNFWVADGLNLYFRFDVVSGTPTLVGEDGNQGPTAFYQIYLDFHGDGTAEYLIDYRNTGVKVSEWLSNSWVQTGTGTGGVGSIVEIEAPGSLFDNWAPRCHETPIWVRSYVDGGGTSNDDDIPNRVEGRFTWERTGIHVTPEPTSIVMIGLGLIGFAGKMIRRKKFMA